MKRFKKPALFTLRLLPIAALAGFFVIKYQLEMYDPSVLEEAIRQLGSLDVLVSVGVVQTVGYAVFCGFFGYLLAEKVGLMKPVRFEKRAIAITLSLSVIFGILFSLDPWVFGRWIPEIGPDTLGTISANNWLGSVLYGGIVEELLLRLFMMSLIAWLLWKLFFRKEAVPPAGVMIAANIIAAMLFAAGHLPATITLFGQLTPLILIRCFLLNGGFGLLFGWLYRKFGIQYAMVSHALLHIVSKLIWTVML